MNIFWLRWRAIQWVLFESVLASDILCLREQYTTKEWINYSVWNGNARMWCRQRGRLSCQFGGAINSAIRFFYQQSEIFDSCKLICSNDMRRQRLQKFLFQSFSTDESTFDSISFFLILDNRISASVSHKSHSWYSNHHWHLPDSRSTTNLCGGHAIGDEHRPFYTEIPNVQSNRCSFSRKLTTKY